MTPHGVKRLADAYKGSPHREATTSNLTLIMHTGNCGYVLRSHTCEANDKARVTSGEK